MATSTKRAIPTGALDSLIDLMDRAWDLRWPISIGLILVIAALLRLVHIGDTPLALSDEVFAAVDAHSVMSTGHHFEGSPATALTYIVLVIDGRLLAYVLHGAGPGPTLGGVRVISAVFGVGAVALMVPLGRELENRALGVGAAAALAIMPWHIYFSRIFYPASEYVFLTSLALLLGLRALRKGSVVDAAGAAAAGVAAIYIYPIAIVSTPLLGATILVLRRSQLVKFGYLRAMGIAAITTVMFAPYLIEHLSPPNPGVAGQNEVFQNAMLWNHGLGPGALLKEFLARWFSYQSLNFTIFSGDPIVRWSIQQMGDVGWVLGPIGWIGAILALARRNASDITLLSWLALYPIPDALTYYDAAPNGVRGIMGSVVWAFLAASTVLALGRLSGKLPRMGIATLTAAALVFQIVAFSWIYFGSYNDRYAYAFETGYEKIYPVLRERHLETVPVTLHAGYRRDIMVQYFSGYRLHATEQMLSCYELPSNVLHFTPVPRVFIVREDPDVQQQQGCIHSGLIERDEAALEAVVPQRGEQKRRVDVIAKFYDDVSHQYQTAILYVHY